LILRKFLLTLRQKSARAYCIYKKKAVYLHREFCQVPLARLYEYYW